MNRIFICYSRVDQPLIKRLAGLLRQSYSRVWYDENLHGGDEWWAEILRQIGACQHFVFIMSDDSLASDWCLRELDEAWRLGKHIIPVLARARTGVPDRLQTLQHIDMSAGLTVESLNYLYAALIRFTGTEQMSQARRLQRDSDRRRLERLWLFIDGRYIEILSDQIQSGRVDRDLYASHITKYLDLRSAARDQFTEVALEEAFEFFDDALIRLDGQLGLTYQPHHEDGRAYLVQPPSARDDSYWLQKFNRLVRQASDVWMRHAALVETIRTVLPNFTVIEEA